jgi:2-succinyl-6-hydroxy-2,4-cyclohexadiene-1-carboxylate synthase
MMAQGLNLLLAQLGLEQTALIGYSMGGRLALYTAVTYPAKISALILESASPGIVAEAERANRAALDDRRAGELLAAGMAAFVEQWYQLPLFQSLQQTPQLLAEVKKNRSQNDPRWAAKIISDLSPGRQPALWANLPFLAMPVMLIAGALDQNYSELVTSMSQAIPDVVTRISPNAGHTIHLEQPLQFAQWVETFLRDKNRLR